MAALETVERDTVTTSVAHNSCAPSIRASSAAAVSFGLGRAGRWRFGAVDLLAQRSKCRDVRDEVVAVCAGDAERESFGGEHGCQRLSRDLLVRRTHEVPDGGLIVDDMLADDVVVRSQALKVGLRPLERRHVGHK